MSAARTNDMMAENRAQLIQVPDSTASLPAGVERVLVYPHPPEETNTEQEAVPLSHYLWVLHRYRWKILAFMAFCVIATVIISKRLTPLYTATATVDIDRRLPSGVLGDQSSNSMAGSTDIEQFLVTQEKLIQSDAVLRPVVQQFHIGKDATKKTSNRLPLSRIENAPIVLRGLTITHPPNTLLLLINYRSPDPQRSADIANAIVKSYIAHTFDIRFRAAADLSAFMEKQIEELKARMERSAGALATFEKDLDVIDPEQKTSMFSAQLLQLNTDLTNAQAERVQREAAYDSIKNGSLEAAEVSDQGTQLRELAARLDVADERFATAQAQYGTTHPEYKKAAGQVAELQRQMDALRQNISQRVGAQYQEAVNREALLKDAVAKSKAEFDRMNARSFQYQSLKQEADTDKTLYEELIKKINESEMNANFQSNSIRLADKARPALYPSYPNTRFNALIALVLSGLLAVSVAFFMDAFDNTALDSEELERRLHTVVLGSLPATKFLPGTLPMQDPVMKPTGNSNGSGPAAPPKPGDLANQSIAFQDGIRRLRSSILLSGNRTQRIKSLLVTSSMPGEGKSTVTAHLAVAHSQQMLRTLLIEGDMRRPSITLGRSKTRGLSNVVNNEVHWQDEIQTSAEFPNLDILATGPASRRAADRVGTVLRKVLDEAEREYDLVIVDSPPLLGFAEPLQMATLVDGVLVLAWAGKTNRNALASVLTHLRRVHANIIGVTLNGMRPDMTDHYYYYGSHKEYGRYSKSVNN
jgi:capsular exopolysaccharide synthesis family protein